VELLSTGLQPAAARTPPPGGGAFSTLGTDEFVRIIFAELANQDPLAPSDSKALLQQLSSLRSIQSDMDMSSRLGALVAQNEMAAAAGLLGKRISGISDDLRRVQGDVASISRTEYGAVLTLRTGERLHMSAVDTIVAEHGS
jgi:flagellar basal-body rod modification protein FlgD